MEEKYLILIYPIRQIEIGPVPENFSVAPAINKRKEINKFLPVPFWGHNLSVRIKNISAVGFEGFMIAHFHLIN